MRHRDMRAITPIDREIVLVGGGHAHVHVLTDFARRPEPGVRLTLVTRDLDTPYSGMLPGLIAGLYSRQQAHIDLVRLTAATGARLIHASACGLDRPNGRLLLEGRPPLAYDLVSIDVGITPALDVIAGAAEHAIAVKPIGHFLAKFEALRERLLGQDGPRRVVVIGGGAGGVELLLSLRHRFIMEAQASGLDPRGLSFTLVTEGKLLATHDARVQEAFRKVLASKEIILLENRRVVAMDAYSLRFADGGRLDADAVLVTTQAAAPRWFRDTGLKLDEDGFIAVSPTLQSLNDPTVFAAGDCATLVDMPREKAGVYAVRAGPPLARNLRAAIRGQKPKPWRPQGKHLALISTGERYAVASRGSFKAEGAWLWRLKDWIDRRWMRMYQDTAAMAERMSRAAPAEVENNVEEMRCGGCAAKIGPGPLSRALARLDPPLGDDNVLIGLGAPDDAAVILPPAGRHLVQTVDFFRAFIDDPFLFGEIAASHALNDVFAMGGTPRHALATAVVPHGASHIVEDTLFQLLAGARRCLDRERVTLVGGHSSEGEALSFGLSVTGEVDPERIIRKNGMRRGDALVLTRPIGTGVLFAAMMRARASSTSVAATLAEMRRSNRDAAALLAAHGARAMTDVTGFGLAGHLGEMLAASGGTASLDLSALPLYPQVQLLAAEGIASTLLPENLALRRLLSGSLDAVTLALLFDPQTAGGLLAAVPEETAAACLAALHTAGHAHAAIIGRVEQHGLLASEARITPEGQIGAMQAGRNAPSMEHPSGITGRANSPRSRFLPSRPHRLSRPRRR
jgi:selenide,water dikinase